MKTMLDKAIAVDTSDKSLTVVLSDGRAVTMPSEWYPRLAEGTAAERAKWRLIGTGQGVHWPDLDEDVSVDAVIRGRPSAEGAASLERWRERRRRSHG